MPERVDPPRVDSHVHIFTTDMKLVPHAWTRPDYGFTAEQLIATLDAHGVQHAVIAGISLFGYDNSYMLQKLREYPRLRGTVNIPPTLSMQELRAMKESGVVGMRLFLSSQLVDDVADIRSSEYQTLFRRVRDLDWHIHFLSQEDVFEDGLNAIREAGVKLVIDHFSNPPPDEGPACAKVSAALRAIDNGNVWMKISAGFRFSPRKGPRTAAHYANAREREAAFDRYILERVSPERLLWGSDCPFVGHEGEVTYEDTLASYAAAVPDARTRRAIDDAAHKFYFG